MTAIFLYSIFSIFLMGLILKVTKINWIGKIERIEPQHIHKGTVPRIGGIYIYISFLIGSYISENYMIFNWLIFYIPILLVSIIEDIHTQLNPYLRLFLLSLFIFIFILNTSFLKLPHIEISILTFINDNNLYQKIFFSFALISIMNGNNMIDGVNGLCITTFIIQIISLIVLSNYLDIEYVSLIYILIPSVIFLLVNYPFGKIFLGDTGSYLLSFLSGCLVINFFAQNPEVNIYYALVILSYPINEMIFSFFRKLFSNKSSPVKSDAYHLHLIAFKVLKNKYNNQYLANNLVLPNLSIILLMPLISYVTYPYINNYATLYIYLSICSVYFALYYFMKKHQK